MSYCPLPDYVSPGFLRPDRPKSCPTEVVQAGIRAGVGVNFASEFIPYWKFANSEMPSHNTYEAFVFGIYLVWITNNVIKTKCITTLDPAEFTQSSQSNYPQRTQSISE
jgi:hypothetical protein